MSSFSSVEEEMFFCCNVASYKRLRKLLKGGANPNAMDGDRHILFCACLYNSYKCVRELLRAGSDASVTWRGMSLLEFACRYNSIDCVYELLATGVTPTAMCADFHRDIFGAVRAVPLFRACKDGDVEAVMHELSTDPSLMNALYPGCKTPLIVWATKHNQVECVRALLDAGADVNAVDTNNSTALHDASIRGNLAVMNLLLECGANLEARDSEGKTPLGLARKYTTGALNAECIERLIVAGARDVVA